MQPANHHLAEFNFGTLKYDWDDPRVAEFADNLDRVNAIAEAADGFVRRMGDEEMEAGQTALTGVFNGNPRTASTLSVWETVESLEHFVWNTVHKQFYAKRRNWFKADGNSNFVMWWVPHGHTPDLQEAMQRFEHWKDHGNSDHAFDWSHLPHVKMWQEQRCG
ncbi:MAG: DUF3291 domain-containing protein [Pseudomonadota bacterium]